MSVVLSDISGLNGADNMPGVGTTIWGIPKGDLATIQTPGADGVTISTPHVPVSGKGFYGVYNSLESGEFKSGMKGGIDGRYQDQSFEGSIPGIRAEVLSMLRKAQNVEMIWIVETANGQKIQLGDRVYPAYISVETGTGKAGSDEVSGCKIMIKSYGVSTILYNANVPLAPNGTITSGAGSFTVVGSTPGFVSVARVALNGVVVDLASYAPIDGETDADTAAALASGINGLGVAGLAATATGNVISGTFPSMYEGWLFSVTNTTNAFSGTAQIIIGAAGATGDSATTKLLFNGTQIPMGSYTKIAGDTTTDEAVGLAADIQTNNGMGFTATNDANVVIVTVPAGSGLTFDGAVLLTTTTGTMTHIETELERTF